MKRINENQTILCVKCKRKIEIDSVFCKYCGKRQSEPVKPKALKRANGMGSVTKLSGRRTKPWCARMTIKDEHGDRKSVVVGCYERKTDALIALEKVINAGGLPQFYNITVSKVRDHWMEKHYPKISDSGISNYNSAWNYFNGDIRNLKMSELKTYHIQKIVDDAAAQGKSRSVCEKIKQLASQLCQWAMQNDVINKNYAQFVEINAKESTPKEPFTLPELQQIWQYYKASGDKTAAAILLLCHTGLRMDEFLSMKKTDYYNGCLHGGSKTEKGSNRSVPVPDVMLPVLDDLMRVPGEYILSNANGDKMDIRNWRNRKYYKTLEAAGFDKDLIRRRAPHSCRHTYATMCARLKMDDKALQDILGHEDITTTRNIYTHTDEEYLKQAAKSLNFINPS